MDGLSVCAQGEVLQQHKTKQCSSSQLRIRRHTELHARIKVLARHVLQSHSLDQHSLTNHKQTEGLLVKLRQSSAGINVDIFVVLRSLAASGGSLARAT